MSPVEPEAARQTDRECQSLLSSEMTVETSDYQLLEPQRRSINPILVSRRSATGRNTSRVLRAYRLRRL
jgi:hypothetical protein